MVFFLKPLQAGKRYGNNALRHFRLLAMKKLISLLTLFLSLCCLPALLAAAPAKRVALLIGNAKYTHERRLLNPVNDARLLGAVLKDELGFDEVTVLEDQKLIEMDEAINRFIANAKRTNVDTALIYFSGHGIRDERRNYLLGLEANTGAPNAAGLKWQGLPADEVRDQLHSLKARVSLLILDACRNGPGKGKTGDKGLANMGSVEGLLVAYAAEEGKVAQDGAGPTGPYAAALAKAWRQPGLPLLAQFDLVADEVRQQGQGQRPTREGDLRADTFLVPEKALNLSRQHDAAWDLCKTAQTVRPCEAYLARYAQGMFAELARVRIAEMNEMRDARERTHQTDLQEEVQGLVAANTLALERIRKMDLLEVQNRFVASSPQRDSAATSWEYSLPTVYPIKSGQISKNCDFCPELVLVPGGKFEMGDDNRWFAGEAPAHPVNIQSFLIGKTEVTQAQWQAVMGSNPSYFKDCGASCPVEQVSWQEVHVFLERLNKITGKIWRLPSEAEWEYCARAGSTTSFPWGEDLAGEFENYSGVNGRDKWDYTAPVASFSPSKFGIYDMNGNVREWVEDCWHDSYINAPRDGSAWVQKCLANGHRVLRGASWSYTFDFLRSAFRSGSDPKFRDLIIGFRVAQSMQ